MERVGTGAPTSAPPEIGIQAKAQVGYSRLVLRPLPTLRRRHRQQENTMMRWISLPVVIATVGIAFSVSAASRNGPIKLAQGAPPEVCTQVYQPVCGTG